MKRINIRLSTLEEVSDFIKICSKYDCDINVYDGSTVIDAKSTVGVVNITRCKEIEVQAITTDESIVSKFIADMKKFGV